MDLAEYFRIPAKQRLSRVEISERLNELCDTQHLGRSITQVSVGLWVSANQVPGWWAPLLERVLNSSFLAGSTSKVVLSGDNN